ncbi:MAG: hypothetical protein E7254_05440 [Lachnospiraceae bacterium]|nr:hypothetical protein [Lachnospiraceae bacterium]
MIECKNCGGNVKFDIKSQKMFCSFCNTYYDPYEFEEHEADAEEHDTYEAKVFTCPQCAGEIISEENEAATFCTFCGASTVLASRILKSKRPDSIIPFQITKDQCKELYRKRMSKALYAPSEYKKEEYIDSFRGIYMPYWIYDTTQDNYVNLKAEKHYRSGNYRIEEEYALDFRLNAHYEGISYDASSSFADNISGAIAPFDYSKAIKFTPAFFSGFYADTTDVSANTYKEDVDGICNSAAATAIENHSMVKGKTVKYPVMHKNHVFGTDTRCKEESMYPVWFVSHRQGDRVSYTTINGLTGKIAADIPIDITKYIIGSLMVAIPIAILLFMFPIIRPTTAVIFSTFLTAMALIIVLSESKSVKNRDLNVGDKGMLMKADTNRDDSDIVSKQYNMTSIIICGLTIALGVFVFFAKPIQDHYYYAVVIAQLLTSIVAYIVVIMNYNLLSTRKLPQFKRKGGDDRA